MHKIVKKFTNYPFAHRQYTHQGHCAQIHGHNWDFEVCIQAGKLDENGFVYDFGKFKTFKNWLEATFDHTCLINEDDPQLNTFKLLNEQGLFDLMIVDSCSCEGIAKLVYEQVEAMVDPHFQERGVIVSYVRVHEDINNSAVYTGNS